MKATLNINFILIIINSAKKPFQAHHTISQDHTSIINFPIYTIVYNATTKEDNLPTNVKDKIAYNCPSVYYKLLMLTIFS